MDIGTINKKNLWIFFVFFSLNIDVALANQKVGLESYRAGEYEKAYKIFYNESKKGNADAQYYLGCMLLKGEGVNKSFMRGFKWLSIAADKGHVKALNVVGVIYKNGVETFKNSEEAKKYFQLTAEKNFNLGQFNLGVLLIENYKEKIKSFSHETNRKKHDEHSDDHSKSGDPRLDLIEGYKWLKISELNGFERASSVLKIVRSEIPHSKQLELDDEAKAVFKSLKDQSEVD